MERPNESPFPATSWTLISRIRSTDPEVSGAALDEVCSRYRYPLYCFVRRRGLDHQDAEDVLHDFMAKFLRNDSFHEAEEGKGRLRGYLAKSLDRFLVNWRERRSRDPLHESVDWSREELRSRYMAEGEALGESPDHFYQRKWAAELLHVALNRLHAAYQSRGREQVFIKLRPVLLAGGSLREGDGTRIGEELSMSGEAVRSALHRMLKEFRSELRNEVRQTLDDPDALEEEIRFLGTLFSRQ